MIRSKWIAPLALIAVLGDARTIVARPRADYEAIVVGTGYGGSVAAYYLSTHGVKTLVLERGRDWTVTDPTTNSTFGTLDSVLQGNGGKTTWLNDTCVGNLYLTMLPSPVPCEKTTGILERVSADAIRRDASPALRINGVEAIVAAGVGGGSLVNNGITYSPTKQGWDLAFPPAELPYMQTVWTELSDKYFARATTGLAPEHIPADILATSYYKGTRLMNLFASLAGYPDEDPANPATLTFGKTIPPVIADWSKVREEIAGTRVPAFIKGEVWWGNNSGAKKSLNKPEGYLGRALATHRVDLKSLHTVTDISYDKETRLYTVSAVHTDLAYHVLENVHFTTSNLIMSAGSLGTTKLLVRARDTGKLPHLNEHVGTRWSTNGNMAHLRVVNAGFIDQGGPAGIKITDFAQAGNPVVLENLPQRVPSFFAGVPQLAPLTGALLTIGIGIPTGKGSFHYDSASDAVVLDWPAGGASNVYDRVTALYSNPAMPGTPIILPPATSLRTTLHPLGGVPLGLATNAHCELRGYKGLYAVDGSIIPGSAAVTNPSLTITAMAERCMDHISRKIAAADHDDGHEHGDDHDGHGHDDDHDDD